MIDLTLWPIYLEGKIIWPSNINTDPEEFFSDDFQESFIHISMPKSFLQKWKDNTDKMMNKCRKVISFLGGLSKKDNLQTPDGILTELGIQKTKLLSKKKLSIPKGMNRSMYVSKNLTLKFQKDGGLSFTINDITAAQKDISKHGEIKGQEWYPTYDGFDDHLRHVLTLIKNESIRNKLFDSIISALEKAKKIITDSKQPIDESIYDQLKDDVNKYFENIAKATDEDIFFLKDFRQFSIDLNEFEKKIIKYAKQVDSISDVSKERRKVFEYCQKGCFFLLMHMQSTINEISKCFQGMYVIDKKFEGQISDIKVLVKFVNEMIKAGIPTKYVSFNIYAVSNESLKGNGNSDNPDWGQTRLALFPNYDKDIVIKIAMNPVGLQCNSIEHRYWNKVKQTEYKDYFAPVYDIHNDGVIITMKKADISDDAFQKLKTTKKAASQKLFEIAKEAHDKHGLPAVWDKRASNVGVIDNQICWIDYGAAP